MSFIIGGVEHGVDADLPTMGSDPWQLLEQPMVASCIDKSLKEGAVPNCMNLKTML